MKKYKVKYSFTQKAELVNIRPRAEADTISRLINEFTRLCDYKHKEDPNSPSSIPNTTIVSADRAQGKRFHNKEYGIRWIGLAKCGFPILSMLSKRKV